MTKPTSWAWAWTVWSCAGAALAQSSTNVGRFDAPAECVDAARLNELIRQNATSTPPAGRRLVGHAERSTNGYRVELFLEENGKRLGVRRLDIDGDDCHREDEALGLVAAMLLEGPPDREPPPDDPPPAPAPTEPQAEPEATDQPDSAGDEPPAPSWRWTVGASGGLTTGLQPGVAPGVTVFGTLRPPLPLELRVPVSYWFPTSADQVLADQTTTLGVEVDRMAAGLELCWLPWDGTSGRVGLCAGGHGLILWGLGRGFPLNWREDSLLLAGSLMARGSLALGKGFQLTVGAGAMVPAGSASFVGQDAAGDEVLLFRTSQVASQFELGLEWGPD